MSDQTILIECLDGYGRVLSRQRFQLTEFSRKLTIGRSLHADVILDDPYAAALHAAIEVTPEGRVLASDLGSVNGLVVGGDRRNGVRDLELLDNTLQVGRTRLRVRTAREAVVAERPDHLRPSNLPHRTGWVAAIAAAACALQTMYTTWLGAPHDLTASLVAALGLAAAVLAIWISFWGLMSRVMQGEWRWTRHAAIILTIAAVYTALTGAVDLGWFAFGIPSWNNRNAWLAAVALGCALFLHLTSASNLKPARAAPIAVCVPLLLVAGDQWLQVRAHTRNVNFIGESERIYPPTLRLRASDTVEGYFRNNGVLKQAADAKLAHAVANDATDDK